MASPQHREEASIIVDVRADCSVTIDAGLAPLSVAIDTDANALSGDSAGADRLLALRDGQATLTLADGSAVSPGPTVRGLAVDTTVAALGLLPGRAAKLTFTTPSGVFGTDLLVNFGDVAGVSETSAPARVLLKGRAKVGRTLTCVAPSTVSKPRYRWLRAGRPIAGATRRTLKLRRSDAGRRVSCRVTGTLGGEKATVTSTAAKITL
jgi:hypothetical protein